MRYVLAKAGAKTPAPDWSVHTWGLDSASLELTGDTLKVWGYSRPILMPEAADQALIRARKGGTRLSFR